MGATYTELSVAESDGGSMLRATAALDRMVAAGDTVETRVFPEIIGDFHRMERRRFDRQGPGWEPLSPMTLARRRRRGIDHDRILEETGRLRAAMTGESDEMRVQYSPDGFFLSVPFYAEYHQVGPRQISVFGHGSATLPQRKVFEVSEVDAMRWAKIIKRGLAITTDVVDLDELG